MEQPTVVSPARAWGGCSLALILVGGFLFMVGGRAHPPQPLPMPFYRIEAILGALLAASAVGMVLRLDLARLAAQGVLVLLGASFVSILVYTQLDAMQATQATRFKPWVILIAFGAFMCWHGVKELRSPGAVDYFKSPKHGRS